MRTHTALAAEPIENRAQKLFSSLPPPFRLEVTREHFPHVLNLLAADWEVPSRFVSLLDAMLIDQRGRRDGFPFETLSELAALREYYVGTVHPEMCAKLDARDPDAWR